MLKKSFVIVLIQFLGSALGLFTIYFVAGSMEPEVYSLVGVYTIIANILLTFTDLGLETTMMREALYWLENGNKDKVKEYSTQALLARVCAFFVLLLFLLAYILYMNYVKYDGSRLMLLVMAIFGAQISSINNSMSLIVRSKGGYVFSQVAATVNNYFVKFLGIGLYALYGAEVYLYFYMLSSLPLCVVYFVKLKGEFEYDFVKLKPMIRKVINAKYLWLKTDLDYVKNNADSLLVSTLFPPAIMGSYTIFKSLEQLAKNVIEGFFDVLSQNMVRFKGNVAKLEEQEKKIKLARNVIIILVALLTCIFAFEQEFFINLVHLSEYASISEMIFCIAFISIIYLWGKFEINTLAFFASSKLNFYMGIVGLVGTLLSFIVIYIVSSINGMLLQRMIVYGIYTIMAIYLFRKEKKVIYSEIKK